MPTPVLATKLFAPARRPQLVARPALVSLLDGTLASGNRLTLVSAPAGFGKSTLLVEWLTHLDEHRPGVHVGWLSLDEGDNDLTRLLTHLVAALHGAGLDSALPNLDARGPTPAALTALVNDLTLAGEVRPGERWVVVLDDYHSVTAPEVHEAVTFLVEHLPEQLSVVVATRADPPLPLARLRSRGQLTEVRAGDLRFTPVEALDFLRGVMALDLTAADAQALDGRTEGWITGLQLAALSLRGIPDRAEATAFIEAFTGSNRFVIDYLADEVLARQPARVRDFLLDTAILERLTGPLCDAVTGGADGRQRLEELDRGNLFLVPLDDQRTWYRYHHLFADVLHARLLADHPDRVPELHRRASDWHADQDLVEDAVRHALAAQDVQRAASLIEEAVPDVRRARRDQLLLSWARSLPDPVVRRSPVLSIVACWSQLMAGDLDAADSWLDAADAALAAGVRDPTLRAAWADTEDLRTAPATVPVYRASLAQARGDVAGTVHHARRALELAGPDDHAVRGAAGGFLGLAAWAAGDVQGARSAFGEAVRSLHAAGNLVDEADTTVVLGDLWIASGLPSRARRVYEQALHTATAGGEPYPRATADLHVGLAELDRERGDLTAAEEHLETARVLGQRSSISENRHRWYVAMAQVRAARGDHRSAVELLDEAERLYRPGFYPELRPIAATRARVQLASGDLAAAAAWADETLVRVDDPPAYLHEYEHLTLARLLIAQAGAGAADRAGAALSLLGRCEEAAVEAAREGSLLEIRVLLAVAHAAAGDVPRALAALNRALAGAPEPEEQVRLFLDEGAPVLALLHHAARGAGTDLAQRHARRLLDRRDVPAGPPDQRDGADPLSQRELEVLRLLATDLTGPQIARELYVTVNTLRTHTKRIFTKLDATTRAAAVRHAHERGIL